MTNDVEAINSYLLLCRSGQNFLSLNGRAERDIDAQRMLYPLPVIPPAYKK
jgi:hypothetical protein